MSAIRAVSVMGAQSSQPIFSISAVARLLDVRPGTIRSWEERYGIVVPERSPGGHRLYSRDQIDQLRFVLEQTADGMQPADAHRVLAEHLGEAGAAPAVPAGAPKLLVLLAERDRYAAELEEYFLRTEGFEVELALGAADAEVKFEDGSPDLAVVELMIGGGTGAVLCRRLKERAGTPILAVSCLDARDEALAAGADAFLPKPFDPLQLVSTVKDLLGQSAFLRSRALG